MDADTADASSQAYELVEPSSDADWSAYYELRWRVLRAPWNQPPGSERDDLEATSFHLMLKDPQGAAVAVGRLHFNTANEAQVRYMAVDDRWRGRGAGSRILKGLEEHAVKRGALTIVLNARNEALPFYLRYGYQVEGPAETLFGTIKHTRMAKRV